jgi:hypothetical protein
MRFIYREDQHSITDTGEGEIGHSMQGVQGRCIHERG